MAYIEKLSFEIIVENSKIIKFLFKAIEHFSNNCSLVRLSLRYNKGIFKGISGKPN